ncbi:hypothetical protein MAPG_03099 [Magnaporthiopsis poae ATCC 64411]|uniref:Uncharacterized protein n=1 Tax=Magnaporthiopsis poae (strain ATCC 64411 / 73-15) TaxID=644358 RepID=A0A0C4DT43_MAGP6|nr:hypothetical protein MAPG_03099 [Magnaporthiopsis poae ATCC 64411]
MTSQCPGNMQCYPNSDGNKQPATRAPRSASASQFTGTRKRNVMAGRTDGQASVYHSNHHSSPFLFLLEGQAHSSTKPTTSHPFLRMYSMDQHLLPRNGYMLLLPNQRSRVLMLFCPVLLQNMYDSSPIYLSRVYD